MAARDCFGSRNRCPIRGHLSVQLPGMGEFYFCTVNGCTGGFKLDESEFEPPGEVIGETLVDDSANLLRRQAQVAWLKHQSECLKCFNMVNGPVGDCRDGRNLYHEWRAHHGTGIQNEAPDPTD